MYKKPLVTSPRDWSDLIGTNYAIRGMDKGVGLNCYGLVREVYDKLNISLPIRDEEKLTKELIQTEGTNWVKISEPIPYCVALMRIHNRLHMGIITDEYKLLHSTPNTGVILSNLDKYEQYILGFYTYKEGGGDFLPDAEIGDTGRLIGMALLMAASVAVIAFQPELGLLGWQAALAVGAISIGGSLLINAIFPQRSDTPDDSSLLDSRTYTWDGIINETRQGLVKPMVFGTILTGGQIISEKVWASGNTVEYYDTLICPAYGRTSSFDEVFINDNECTQYLDAIYETRNGDDEQIPIPYFEDEIWLQYGSNRKIPYDEATAAITLSYLDDEAAPINYVGFTSKNQIEKGSIELSAPRGLFCMMENEPWVQTVKLFLQYKSTSTVTWTTVTSYTTESGESETSRSFARKFNSQDFNITNTYVFYAKNGVTIDSVYSHLPPSYLDMINDDSSTYIDFNVIDENGTEYFCRTTDSDGNEDLPADLEDITSTIFNLYLTPSPEPTAGAVYNTVIDGSGDDFTVTDYSNKTMSCSGIFSSTKTTTSGILYKQSGTGSIILLYNNFTEVNSAYFYFTTFSDSARTSLDTSPAAIPDGTATMYIPAEITISFPGNDGCEIINPHNYASWDAYLGFDFTTEVNDIKFDLVVNMKAANAPLKYFYSGTINIDVGYSSAGLNVWRRKEISFDNSNGMPSYDTMTFPVDLTELDFDYNNETGLRTKFLNDFRKYKIRIQFAEYSVVQQYKYVYDFTSHPSASSFQIKNLFYNKEVNYVNYISFKGDTKNPTNPVLQTVNIDFPTKDYYDYRICSITKPKDKNYWAQDVYLKLYSDIIEKTLAYPNHTLLGMRIRATDSLSGGRPGITSILTGPPLAAPPSTSCYSLSVVSDSGVLSTTTYLYGVELDGTRAVIVNGELPSPIQTPTTITAINKVKSNFTILNHGYETDDDVWAYNIKGINDGVEVYDISELNNKRYKVAKINDNQIALKGVDFSSYSLWTSGGNIQEYDDTYYWMVRNSSDGYCQDDRVLTKFYDRIEAYELVGDGTTRLYLRTAVNTVTGGVTIFSEDDASTNDTAWVVAKMLIDGSSGKITADNIDWDSFSAWNDWNNGTITYKGVDYKRHQFDAVIDFSEDLWQIAFQAASTARGILLRSNNKYKIVMDKAVTNPTQIFSEGNVANVRVDYIPKSERANVLVSSFLDRGRYSEDTSNGAQYFKDTPISRSDVISGEQPIVKTIPSMIGVTRECQASMLLDYMLAQNRYISHTITFDAGIDSIELEVGDVFGFQSTAANLAIGGKIYNSTATYVTLDQSFTPITGTIYQLDIWGSDGTIYTSTQTFLTTDSVTTFNLPTTYSVSADTPYENTYMLYRNTIERTKYRCLGIKRQGNTLNATIVGIEYRSEVYEND